MTAEIIAWLESELEKFRPAIKKVENDGHEIVTDAVSYIKINGLHDLEQIALAFISGMTAGTPWAEVLAGIKTQAVADGVKLLEGSEAVVAAKAQGDLIALGTIAPSAA